MKRPGKPSGFTLIEIMVATALTLTMMAAVVQIFAMIGESVSDSRAVLEMCDRLRSTSVKLTDDLSGVTVTMVPPRRSEDYEGYFVIMERDLPIFKGYLAPQACEDGACTPDPSVGDYDDILMFTTRGKGDPFVGRCALSPDGTTKSNVVEVIWFVRGTTLYRRQLLVAPGVNLQGVSQADFYRNYDLSVHWDTVNSRLVANSLGDLTRPECRFAYNPDPALFPPRPPYAVKDWDQLGMPTLCECTSSGWTAGTALPPVTVSGSEPFDAWNHPNPWDEVDPATGHLTDYYTSGSPQPGQRVSEDVILTDVIGFDVKVWDPSADAGVGGYVDLGDGGAAPGDPKSGLAGDPGSGIPFIYDTWSLHYEYDGRDQDSSGIPDQAINGFDDNENGIVDDIMERETMPPYPVPLRGIQVKIRVFERASRQIREVTIVQDFLPK